jgi:hypothetical protein
MTRSRPLEQRHHAMVVGRGLYLLRYVSAPADKSCPSIAVNQHPNNRDITLIAAPGGSDTYLEAPGDCMVVRADAPGSLSLVAAADGLNTNIDAEIRLERIIGATQPERAAQRPAAKQAQLQDDPGTISILAHVSRRGDVIVEPGEWICGPDLPLPIEGVEIRWPQQPHGVELAYSAVSGRIGQKRAASAGEFAGTRGRAAPLTGLEMSLTCKAGSEYELAAEALFLGAAIVSQRGRKLSFTGPSGREPLVGLRLDLVKVQSKLLPRAEPAAASEKRPPRKVRVYRSAPGTPALINHNLVATADRGI